MNHTTTTDWKQQPRDAWLAYEPSPDEPWDLTKVLRMHRRAGLGTTWADAERDVADGYDAAIKRLLEGAPTGPDGRTAEALDMFADAMLDSYRAGSAALDPVRIAWLHRLTFTAWPLRERMILAWHTHYATSETKVFEKETLVEQHLVQRRLWRAPTSELHLAMLRDSAMLYWLDGASNLRSSVNENLAREFFELLALGVGNYSEQDVRESARALTGWQRVPERTKELKYLESMHDPGEMTILDHTGNWRDEDVVRIASAQPAAAQRIAWRLWRTFVSNVDEPTPELLEGLAATMRVDGDVDVSHGLETLLRSRLFHSTAYVDRRVPSPVEWTVGVLRSCEAFPPRPNLIEVSAAIDRMGQRFFRPPNVAGWPGGMEWLAGPGLVARQNFAAWLTGGESKVPVEHWDQVRVEHQVASGDAEIEFWTTLLWGRTASSEEQAALAEPFDQNKPDARARLVRAVLCAPNAQLC